MQSMFLFFIAVAWQLREGGEEQWYSSFPQQSIWVPYFLAISNPTTTLTKDLCDTYGMQNNTGCTGWHEPSCPSVVWEKLFLVLSGVLWNSNFNIQAQIFDGSLVVAVPAVLVMLRSDLTQQHLLSSLLRQYFWPSVSGRLCQSPAKAANLLRNLALSPSTHVVTCKQVEMFPFNVLAQAPWGQCRVWVCLLPSPQFLGPQLRLLVLWFYKQCHLLSRFIAVFPSKDDPT